MPTVSGTQDRTEDPTLCPPDQQQAIEAYYGFRLDQADPDQLKLLVGNSRLAGNTCFKERRYRGDLRASVVLVQLLQQPSQVGACRGCQLVQPGHCWGPSGLQSVQQSLCSAPGIG